MAKPADTPDKGQAPEHSQAGGAPTKATPLGGEVTEPEVGAAFTEEQLAQIESGEYPTAKQPTDEEAKQLKEEAAG
jgi:hypothetical protein